MTSSAKSRSRSVSSVDPRMGAVVNDNTPPAFPAHELSGLDELPRPPAAEAVVHYARLTLIPSYPAIPDKDPEANNAAPDVDALPERSKGRRLATRKRAISAGLCSLVFHAAVFAALTMAVVTLPDEPVEEAGDSVSVVMLGNAEDDQMASGEEQQEPPKPDEIVAESVQPDVVQPTDSKTADVVPAEPVTAETPPIDAPQAVQPAMPVPETVQPEVVQPTQAVTQVAPETVVSPEPEVLAAVVPAEPTVSQPMATEIQPEPTRQAAAPPTTLTPSTTPPEAVQPMETIEAAPPIAETVTPIEKPTPPAKPVQKPKEVVRKPPPKATKVKSGSKGESEQDAKKGSAEGTESAEADRASQSAGNRQGSGSAAVANYPGKVQSRIRRSVRVPSEYRRMTAAMTVRVRLTVDSGGQLSSLSLARSSGISELDNAVLEGVRRAAPFPPLPSEWGKPSWSFTQEVQVTGK